MRPQRSETSQFLYLDLADRLEAQIRNGHFQAGERLPSLRMLHRQTGLSISTVYQSFAEMEKRGLVMAREKSGFFVQPCLTKILPVPNLVSTRLEPARVNISNLALALMEAITDPKILQLGSSVIAPEMLPSKHLAQSIKAITLNRDSARWSGYAHYQGFQPLRRMIANRLTSICGSPAADEVVITNGCMEAVSLCLQAVAQPGDTILVSSPTFPWFLQLIEDFGMYALEIPAGSSTGIDLEMLQEAIGRHRVRACLLMANFSNPLGYLMSDTDKQHLVRLLEAQGIPIIEDDLYGDLYFTGQRPVPFKAFDRQGMVLYCSSFSKTLAPGLRLGWTLAGRYLEKVRRLKLNQSIATATVIQMAAADYLTNGHYDRHLRKLRTFLKNQVSNISMALARHFPVGTYISAPEGGITIWVQCHEDLDSLALFRSALAADIAILPGIICASGPWFRNCFRLSCGIPYSETIEKGIQTLAQLVRTQHGNSTP